MPHRKNQNQTRPNGLDPKLIYRKISVAVSDGKPKTIDEDKRSVEVIGGTEQPVMIYDYAADRVVDEILLMSGIEMPKNRQVPLLDTHYRWDTASVLGSYREMTADNGQLVGRAYFSTVEEAESPWTKVREGHLTDFSVGYHIIKSASFTIPAGDKAKIKGREFEASTERPLIVRTRWSIKELSVVPIGADDQAKARTETNEDLNHKTDLKENPIMPEPIIEPTNKRQDPPAPDTAKIIADETAKARKAEQDRQRKIDTQVELLKPQGFDFTKMAAEAKADGTSVSAFNERILKSMADVKPVETSGDLDMTQKEIKTYRIVRALNALANPTDHRAQEAAAFELECSRAFADKSNRQARGIIIPPDVLKRDLLADTDNVGGYTVGTDLLSASFIELLRNKMVVKQAGATLLTGLVGDVAIPKQTGGATAYWLDENDSTTESAQAFGQLALTPKTVAALTEISRKLLIQSSIDIENFVKTDLATALAIAMDLACLHGTGTNNQPTGVAATNGIGSVAGGTNGLTPALSHIVNLETEVATDNADIGALSYISNAKVRGKLKQVFTNATYGDIAVWGKGSAPGVGEMNGYPAFVTNQASSALTKGSASGTCSAIFYGNWSDLIIALWAGLDVLVDPYTNSATGAVRVTAFQSVDIGVRHAESFAAMLDALTV